MPCPRLVQTIACYSQSSHRPWRCVDELLQPLCLLMHIVPLHPELHAQTSAFKHHFFPMTAVTMDHTEIIKEL